MFVEMLQEMLFRNVVGRSEVLSMDVIIHRVIITANGHYHRRWEDISYNVGDIRQNVGGPLEFFISRFDCNNNFTLLIRK